MTKKQQVTHVLRLAKELIEPPGAWCKGYVALRSTPPMDDDKSNDAVQHWVDGRMLWATHNHDTDESVCTICVSTALDHAYKAASIAAYSNDYDFNHLAIYDAERFLRAALQEQENVKMPCDSPREEGNPTERINIQRNNDRSDMTQAMMLLAMDRSIEMAEESEEAAQ